MARRVGCGLADAVGGAGALKIGPTLSMVRKRIGATLKALHHKGAVRQDGHLEGRSGWQICNFDEVPSAPIEIRI